jgi:hypothetical protein
MTTPHPDLADQPKIYQQFFHISFGREIEALNLLAGYGWVGQASQ